MWLLFWVDRARPSEARRSRIKPERSWAERQASGARNGPTLGDANVNGGDHEIIRPRPKCGTMVQGFQTKDGDLTMDRVEIGAVVTMYSRCECGHRITLSRAPPSLARATPRVPATLEQAISIGFPPDSSFMSILALTCAWTVATLALAGWAG
jgi:hypothetical protein